MLKFAFCILFFLCLNILCFICPNAINKFNQNSCSTKIEYGKDCVYNLALIEFNLLNKPSEQRDLYLKFYQILLAEYNLHKDDMSSQNVNLSSRNKHLEVLECLSVVTGRLAVVSNISSALSFAKQSKNYAEAYLALVSDAGMHIALGSLYCKVPSYPIGFGDFSISRMHFDKYIDMCKRNSNVCVNFVFHQEYADFLRETDMHREADELIKAGLKIEPRDCLDFMYKKLFENYVELRS